MSKFFRIVAMLVMLIGLSSFVAHKFYVSIYQIELNEKSKRLEITTRIFVDDLNEAIKLDFKHHSQLGESAESVIDQQFLKKYMQKHFTININNKPKSVQFVSHELQEDVCVIYMKVKDVSKIKSLQVKASAIMNLQETQQNIIQVKIGNQKKSNILTTEKSTGILHF